MSRSPDLYEEHSITDRFGDTIAVSTSYGGYVLISISGKGDEPDRMVEIPAIDIIPLFTAAVKATGMTPNQLRQKALKEKIVDVRTIPQNRQARRKAAREQLRTA